MLHIDMPEEEKQTSSDDPAGELAPDRAGAEAKAESSAMETDKPGDSETAQPPKRRRAFHRIAGLLLLAGLLVAGFAYRGRLLGLMSGTATETAKGATSGERKVLYWVDPMHPAYKSDKPGKAPDCGMDLVPVYEGGPQGGTNYPAGTVQISPERQQLIGVKYGQVAYRNVSKTLRTVGRLAYDETRVTHVHTRYEGWIEEVFVDFTGKLVNRGQPLLSIYSPELLQTQQEFLLARRGRLELGDSPFREAAYGASSLYEAARRRLELWEMSEEQIEELERSGKPIRALPLFAPNGGFVLTRNAFQKQRVTPETELYTIADLSRVWVVADIYEFEAAEIKLGQAASMTLAYSPGRTFRGQVTYIYPQLDNITRTLKVRIEMPNPDFALKPDMYANVELKIDYGRHLIVPEEAVLDSGAEQQVFVAHEGGYFEPRRVTLGAKLDDEVIVLSGLRAGEIVVTSANFLIDSESRLKSATGGMGAPGGHNHGGAAPSAGSQSTPADHSQHNQQKSAPSPSLDHSQHQPEGKSQSRTQEDNNRRQHARPPENDGQAGLKPAPEDHSQHVEAAEAHGSKHSGLNGKILYYYCPMHAEQRSNEPGTCPKCQMQLIPKHAGEK